MKAHFLAMTCCAVFALPQMAAACFQLSENVWMCANDTAWEDASWDPYGDGSTLLLEDYVLNFTEDFPGSEIRDSLTTLEEQFVTYATLMAADGTEPLEIHTQEVLAIEAGMAFRSLQRDLYDDTVTVSAVMLADIRDARIMLYLDGPPTLSWADIDTESAGILNILRDSCADVASCESPGQSKITSE